MELPGTIFAKNITPAAIGDWTDGGIYRMITTGVNRDNGAAFPLMPYLSYRYADPEDVKAVVAYLRTLAPIENQTPPTKLDSRELSRADHAHGPRSR
ncbi:MAG: hypothetical protein M5R36_12145 [Deltaproteobacteria bacterium]|nr:hypothetical protein [Deltaproteobacteria bacterium]